MSRFPTRFLIGFFVATSCLVASQVWGQSGSRQVPSRNSYQAPKSNGSGSRAQASGTKSTPTRLAMEGYCPVCLKDMKKWVKGNSAYQAVYDGQVYYFMSAAQAKIFLANPTRYIPVLGGDCVTCLAKMGNRMPGNIRHAAYHQGRLYLFAGEDQKQMFLKDAPSYAEVDLAMGGKCAVCRVEMNQEVQGDANISTTFHGMRYLFPGADQRRMFLVNPNKYVKQ